MKFLKEILLDYSQEIVLVHDFRKKIIKKKSLLHIMLNIECTTDAKLSFHTVSYKKSWKLFLCSEPASLHTYC